MANKTPYELGYDMYNTAMERLQNVYYADENLFADGIIKERPSYPTVEETIVEAKEIMKFVNG